jgi:hypothetical protein
MPDSDAKDLRLILGAEEGTSSSETVVKKPLPAKVNEEFRDESKPPGIMMYPQMLPYPYHPYPPPHMTTPDGSAVRYAPFPMYPAPMYTNAAPGRPPSFISPSFPYGISAISSNPPSKTGSDSKLPLPPKSNNSSTSTAAAGVKTPQFLPFPGNLQQFSAWKTS